MGMTTTGGQRRKGRRDNDNENGGNDPEGTTALTQHPPCHSKHLLAWGLWVLQRDDEGQGKDRDNDHDQDHNEDEEAPQPPLRAPARRVEQGC